nr:hypothetical protein [uncultured Mucilaginibacter sp.]
MLQGNKIICVLSITLLVYSSFKIDKSKDTRQTTNFSIPFKPLQDDCPRGAPEPILNKRAYPNRTFRIARNVGYENITLKNGDKLKIQNKGCEYFTLEFRFETSKFSAANTDLKYWGKCSVDLLNGIRKNADVPFDIIKGLNSLSVYYLKSKKPTLGRELDFGEGEIRNFVTLDRIEKLSGKLYAVTVSFSVGPL